MSLFTSVIISVLVLSATLWFAVLSSPIILLSHVSATVGTLYYYVMFYLFSVVILRFIDSNTGSRVFEVLHQDTRNASNLRILEVGAGTGANFKFYPNGCTIISLELNPILEKHAARIKRDYPHLTIEKSIIGNIENVQGIISDSSFDIVVATHVLCCVKNKEAALKEIHRILRPGGKLLINDMVYFNENDAPIKRLVQKLWSPIHRFITLGCTAGAMDLQSLLSKMGFDTSQLETLEASSAPIPYARSLFGPVVKA